MNVIVDASAILAVLLDEERKDVVIQATQGAVLVAPSCLEYEIGNALTALIKRDRIQISDAVKTYIEFCKIPIRFESPDIPSSIIIAGKNNMYAYDAYYLSCSERMNLPLLTLDNNLKKIAEERGVICL